MTFFLNVVIGDTIIIQGPSQWDRMGPLVSHLLGLFTDWAVIVVTVVLFHLHGRRVLPRTDGLSLSGAGRHDLGGVLHGSLAGSSNLWSCSAVPNDRRHKKKTFCFGVCCYFGRTGKGKEEDSRAEKRRLLYRMEEGDNDSTTQQLCNDDPSLLTDRPERRCK